MSEPRRVLEPERQIPEFDVFLVGDRWQAIYRGDYDLVIEHSDWIELFFACVSARIRAEIQRAAEEMAERMSTPDRTWRHNGPGSGINA